ncbi:MAG TPA: hypothetical protein VFU22_33100 [Roseiflexaceae bacterium]|nr:hypothetical protein [Roseiflexaceae bacterium]
MAATPERADNGSALARPAALAAWAEELDRAAAHDGSALAQ